jgi:glutaredoxin 3
VAKEFLGGRGVPYREVDVSRDRAAAVEMVRRTGQQGVPVIQVGEQYIVGFDRPRLERALAALPRTDGAGARPTFGAAIADAAGVALERGAAATAGAYIGRVRPDTPAARAGLRAGDVIVAVDGRPVADAGEAEAALRALPPGRPFSVTYQRGGERRTARATLG